MKQNIDRKVLYVADRQAQIVYDSDMPKTVLQIH